MTAPEDVLRLAGCVYEDYVEMESNTPNTTVTARLVDGATFILDQPDAVPPICGEDDRGLWSPGESLEIVGPPGVGKTTLTGQLTLSRLGLRGDVLGFPVVPGLKRVLYLACDRPPQIARSFRRMAQEEDREVLADRLRVWRGPPVEDLARHPETLLQMAEDADADTAVLDSFKDVALGLSDDDVGAGLNSALQLALVGGVEVIGLHHQRKPTGGNAKPNTLSDVYGSVWITAGAGSVVLLWGNAGDPVVELTHLKQPADAVGPLHLLHDHDAGTTTVIDQLDVDDLVRAQPGITAQDVARLLFDTATPDRNQKEKARRKLDKLVGRSLYRSDGTPGGEAARYYQLTSDGRLR
ncbi:hypothetical protein BH18ACT1_BH18ACT1_00240 [soil metagenome]